MSPTRSASPCPRYPCPNLRPCPVHNGKQERKVYDAERGPDRQFYSTPRWRTFRAWFLAQHPLCLMCEETGRVVPANEVDHTKGRREYPELAFDEDNCRSLCKHHHSQRTARDQGFARGVPK
jgi:5-methylcytosine-specific restriction enzyme A